ncbi:hypothetical protein OIU34_22205 [Pararhizobium sp. BT-229]|uniref:hypothetical protein n=1 Tax=Pararhizobium sp. BT-229 TaxID=2986923 RepID=UPI0021F724DA|nr:hypothetical protein [Pararhizobium sp. BT-229]MCV9964607.1 hypothetical protein [Pararhizobium sp. BT-229]
MNKGSELIILWLMNQNGFDDEFTDAFLDALYTGCSKGEADAVAHRDTLVAQAMTMDHGDMKDAIQAAFEFHKIKLELNRELAGVKAYRKIEDALADTPTSLLGKRIIKMKIKNIVADYNREAAS